MRLRMIGAAVIAAGLGWLSCTHALADISRSGKLPVAPTDTFTATTAPASRTEIAGFEMMSPLPGDANLFAQRQRLATATPIANERSNRTQATVAAASFSSPPERPPSVWLMLAVTLLLIGYQLRRKHRLLRPHRFHRV